MTMADAIRGVVHPLLGITLGEAGLVSEPGPERVEVSVLDAADPVADRVRDLARPDPARVDVKPLSPAGRAALGQRLAGRTGIGPGTRVWHLGAVAAGLGRSTLLMGVALQLAEAGHAVGVLDATEDQGIWRTLVPGDPPAVLGQVVLPRRSGGVLLASAAAFWPGPTPLGWGAAEFHTITSRAVGDVLWNAPDVLLVDLPAGTGPRMVAVRRAVPGGLVWVHAPLAPEAPVGDLTLRALAPARPGEWGEIPYDPGLAEGGSPGAELARRLRDLSRWLLTGAP